MDRIYAEYDPGRDSLQKVPGYNFTANLVNKHPFFQSVFLRPAVYQLMRHFLGQDCILSSLNSLEPLKGQDNQRLHRDRLTPPGQEVVAMNSLWVIDDMDRDNGATRVVPGSHRMEISPDETEQRAVHVAAPAGHVIVINSSLLHGASANHSGRRRRIVHGYFTRRGLEQQTEQKKYLSPQVQASLPPLARQVLALDD
jgi:ectoine hydroxylase-related dioxygenase (phytanoyl-CoA dioxygenase family)